MKIRAMMSSLALVAGLSLSGAASAQSYMMDGNEIPAERVQEFSDKCSALQAAANASLSTLNDTQEEVETGSASSSGTASPSDPAAEANWDEALASLSAEDCAAAGFPIANAG